MIDMMVFQCFMPRYCVLRGWRTAGVGKTWRSQRSRAEESDTVFKKLCSLTSFNPILVLLKMECHILWRACFVDTLSAGFGCVCVKNGQTGVELQQHKRFWESRVWDDGAGASVRGVVLWYRWASDRRMLRSPMACFTGQLIQVKDQKCSVTIQ